jgi:hypothetical protein
MKQHPHTDRDLLLAEAEQLLIDRGVVQKSATSSC